MTTTPTADHCCGPAAATAAATAVLDAAGWDRVTVAVVGPRGSGRTRVLRDVQDAARRRGVAVVRAPAIAGGGGRPLAVFQQIVGRVPSPGVAVPPDVRVVVEQALGLYPAGAEPEVDPARLVDAAVTRLRELAARSRVVVVVDDVDPGQDDLAEFVAGLGRALPAGVSLVRAGHPLAGGLLAGGAVVEIAPWCPFHAARVLDGLARPPSGVVRFRLLAQVAGHPRALTELGGRAADHPEWGQPGLPVLPVPGPLVDLFAPGLAQVPLGVREGLAVAAVARGDLRVVDAVAPDARTDPGWSVALDNGWARVRGRRLHFRHPMAHAAAHHGVSPSRLRLLQRRISTAVEPDTARAAWYRAVSGAGAGESLAAGLEQTSVGLTSRGAPRAAIEVLTIAASVSPGAGGRDRRQRMAARLARAVDEPEWADALDAVARPAARAAGVDSSLAALVDVVVDVVDDVYRTGRPSRPDLPPPTGVPSTALPVADAVATLRRWAAAWSDLDTRRGEVVATVRDPALGAALGHAAAQTATPRSALDRLVGKAALLLDETDVAVVRLLAAAAPARRAGAVEGDAAEALVWALVDAGRTGDAAEWASRILRTRRVSVEDRFSAGARVALAVVDGGRLRAPDDGFRAASTLFDPRESPYLAVRLQRAKGAAAASDGRHDDAWRSLRAVWSDDVRPIHDVLSDLAVGDLAAAAVHTQRADEARDLLLRVMSRQGDASLRQRLVLHRARALLTDDDGAEQHFRLALDHPGGAGWPHERAVARLDFAEWLRRRQRPADARPQLRAARAAFAAADLPLWTDRAARELAAAHTSRGDTTRPGSLTLQQRRIAELAAEGLTDRQIADRLFLSVRTVGTHLTQVFRSLGVRRRMHLAAALADLEREPG